MTQLLFKRDEELAQWAEETYPECAPIPRPFSSIGIASKEGEVMGVVFYHEFRHYDVEVTVVTATQRWATPGNIRAILHFPFIQQGVKRMTAKTAKSNTKARKMLEGLGAVLEGVHPYGDNGVGRSCTYGLYRDVALEKWIN